MGQRFPLVPDVPEEEVAPTLEQLGRWVCQDLVATWVYRLFRAETPEQRDAAEAVRGNVRLYHFLRCMQEKDKPLARLLTRGAAVPREGLAMFGGCYVAGTGVQPEEQGFIAGVFRRLTEAQNYVSWTAEGLAEEADYEHWRRRGYFGLAVLVAAIVTFLGYLAYLTFIATPPQ
jgi:hypothetical protein